MANHKHQWQFSREVINQARFICHCGAYKNVSLKIVFEEPIDG